MAKRYSLGIFVFLLFFWNSGFALGFPLTGLAGVRRDFLQDHRVFEKVIEGKSEWESLFCQGVYTYRVMLRTQLKDLEMELAEDGSVVLQSILHEPYVGFQGKYQGAYSFCFPVSKWAGLSAEAAKVTAKVEFRDTEDGRVVVAVKVKSIELGRLMSDALSDPWEERLTALVNQGMEQVWSTQLGEWFNERISAMVNQQLPGHPPGN